MLAVQRQYNVFPIEPPPSPAQLTAYKALRLTSLQTDPHAFGSTYAREAAPTEDVWRQRLDPPLKRTFIASVTPVLGDTSEQEQAQARANVHPDGHVNASGESDSEWIGMAGISAPSGTPPFVLAPFKAAGVGAHWAIYCLYAMWVHPAHRGKGIGAQLVNACLEWARTNVDPEFSSTNNDADGGGFEKVVALLVYDDNVAGRALYSRTGFTEPEGVSADKGERWMVAKGLGSDTYNTESEI